MEMGLAHDQFLLVQAGTKTIEIPLYKSDRSAYDISIQIGPGSLIR